MQHTLMRSQARRSSPRCTGGDAHSLTAEPSRFDASARINSWASGKIPLYGEVSGAVDVGTIQALPDFVPALQPSPTNP